MIPRIIAVFCLAILASCATTGTRQVRVAEWAPCADSTYLELRRQHPDSLSERGWLRLQSLERDCATTREESSQRGTAGMTDASHRGRSMWLGAAVMMVAMMFAIR